MQADGRLIQHIQHAAQARPDLRGETDALPFAAGERGGIALQREVAEPHRAEKFEALHNLAPDALGDKGFARREAEVDGRRERPIQRQRGEVGDGKAADFDGEGLGTQALAPANRAGRRGHVAHHVFAIAVAARFLDGVAQVGENPMEAGARRFALGRSINQNVLLFGRKIFKGKLEVDLVAVRGQLDQFEEVLRGRPRPQSAIQQRLVPVGDDFGGVEVVQGAQAVALRAGAEGGVEAEAARLQPGHVEAAVGAGHGG